jgi:hypothetical protein
MESIQVARPGSGSIKRSVARASYRRKAHRTVHSGFPSRAKRDGGLGSNDRRRELSARAARPHERATGVSEARSHEATPAKTRGLNVRSGGSGRRRRETSCPSIHHAPGLIPRGRQVGREPRARVQVRQVGRVAEVGRTYRDAASAASSPKETPQHADACARWRQGEPVRHASSGTLQIREKQTTRSACVLRVRTRPKASRLEAVCALYGVHARRAWSCGSSKLRDGWGRSCGACRATIETSEMGSIAM